MGHKGKMSFDIKISQGDLAIGSDGDLARVEDTDKLVQDVLKILMTKKREPTIIKAIPNIKMAPPTGLN